MPAPRSIARFNRRFTNKLTLKVAGYLPGFAIVSHVGRKSGRTYRTPVNAFRTDDGYIIALTYGSESDWVKNVLAAGQCELQTRGRRVRLISPRIETDESKSWAPRPVRLILGLIDAPQYMRLSLECARPGSTAPEREVQNHLLAEVVRHHPDRFAGSPRWRPRLGAGTWRRQPTSSASSSAGRSTGTRACSSWSGIWVRLSRSCCPGSR